MTEGLEKMFESRESRVERRRNPKSRRGISLTEVLIAMGIMTVGLLGVASVFPVGGWYMQRARFPIAVRRSRSW